MPFIHGHTGGESKRHEELSSATAERTYAQLRAEAVRTQVPATTLAREAIDLWLRNQLRAARHEAIAGYAEEMAGTNLDLDPDLESAGIEYLVKTGKERK